MNAIEIFCKSFENAGDAIGKYQLYYVCTYIQKFGFRSIFFLFLLFEKLIQYVSELDSKYVEFLTWLFKKITEHIAISLAICSNACYSLLCSGKNTYPYII